MKALTLTFNNTPIHATHEAWFNATDMAKVFDKKPAEWLRLPETEKYITLLCEIEKVGLSHLLRTTKGRNGVTWLSPKLAIRFAQWLDTRFAIWCDKQIYDLLSGLWQQSRDDTKASNRVMGRMLHVTRQYQGKEAKHYHYSNENLLCYEVLTGKREKCDREQLTSDQLKRLKEIEIDNGALLGVGMPYSERKAFLNSKHRNNLVEVAL